MTKKLTPAQQQYADLKKQYDDCILFFRMGDFYETFHDDAKIAHKVLDITLTARDKKSDAPIPMAGIPHHALERYLPKLVKAGYKVALAEQVGAVVPGRVVERRVTQVITPGTYIEETSSFNYLVALSYGGTGNDPYHLARGDFSLGVYKTKSFS